MSDLTIDDFVAGYLDGYNPDAPAPSGNRSDAYRHSFEIGRREAEGLPPVPAAISRARAAEIEARNV